MADAIPRSVLELEIKRDYDWKLGRDALVALGDQDDNVLIRLEHYSFRSRDQRNRWLFVRAEVHKLLCSEIDDYKRERELLQKTATPAISLLTGLIVGATQSPVALASAIAAVALLIPLKIGVRAWCAEYASSPTEISSSERQAVKQIDERK